MSQTLGDAVKALTKARMKRIDKELYAAWRAGYDYLYVVEEEPGAAVVPGGNDVGFRAAFIPSNSDRHKFRGFRCIRYDLRRENLTPDEQEVLHNYSPGSV